MILDPCRATARSANDIPVRVCGVLLIGRSAAEAAQYVLSDLRQLQLASSTLAHLNRDHDRARLDEELLQMRSLAGVAGKGVDFYTTRDVLNLTDASLAARRGNCAEMCLIAGRALCQNGYRGRITFYAMRGVPPGLGVLDHMIMRIGASGPTDNDYEFDPFVALLDDTERRRFCRPAPSMSFSGDLQAGVAGSKASYCFVGDGGSGAYLCGVSDIASFRLLHVGTLSVDDARTIQYLGTGGGALHSSPMNMSGVAR